MQKFYDCGIDLGTTNSCIAVPDDNNGYIIIENQADNMLVIPSAIHMRNANRIEIGARAYNSQDVENIAIQFKRQMGTNKLINFKRAGVEKTPEDLSKGILMQLRLNAEARMNRSMENVVITVPAAFKTLQSEATNKAGKMAGFKNVILLQEPIAAAVAYGVKPDSKDKLWMVFDYGGGTLDVAIISTENGLLTVKNSEGDNYFGGSDLDREIFQSIVVPKLKEEGYVIDRLFDETTFSGKSICRKVLLECEKCKIKLSSTESAEIEIFDIDDDNGQPIDFIYDLKREEFEALITDTVDKSITIAKKALEGAKIQASQLDKILLVGGSTFIPLVRKKLSEVFGVQLDSSVNPMTVVAAGAAIYASSSVIDIAEEENEVTEKASKAVLSLTYDNITSQLKVNVIGKVNNNSEVGIKRIKVDRFESADRTGVLWSSGWIDLIDIEDGIFDIDVVMQESSLNHFYITGSNSEEKEVEIMNPEFSIRHNNTTLKASAPPAPMSIGIRIQDKEAGYDVLDVLIAKNTPLPSKQERIYKTAKELDPDKEDVIAMEIFEGEYFENPDANSHVGTITLVSSAMNRVVPEGTEIEISLEADISRNIIVQGYIPDFDYEIPEKTLRPEAKIDFEEKLDKVDERMKQAKVSVLKLKNAGKDTTKFESELERLSDEYDDAYTKLDSDEAAVNEYLNTFDNVQTEIIKEERKMDKSEPDKKAQSRYEEAKNKVENWGDDDTKDQFEELDDAYQYSSGEDETNFVLEKMELLGFSAMTSNFEWLSGFYKNILAQSMGIYSNEQKAEYWKTKAEEAIEKQNAIDLRTAVFELLDLKTSSASDAIAAYKADLTR